MNFNTVDKITAIISLHPTASVSVDDNVVQWYSEDITEPTSVEIDTEMNRLQVILDGQSYARTRKDEYDLLNQDEMRFDDQINSTTTWVDAILAIKAAHPKP